MSFKGIRPYEVVFSPCEKYVAAAGYQEGLGSIGLLIVWDLQTKKEVFRRGGLKGVLSRVSFSVDGKRLAAGGSSSYKTAKVWDFPSGKEIAQLENDDSIDGLCFSPDGKLLAMGTVVRDHPDCAVRLWDARTFREKSVLLGSKLIMSLAFSSDGELLAAVDAHGNINLWNAKEAKDITARVVSDKALTSVLFSPNGKMLACGGRTGQIVIFDPADFNKPAPILHAQDGGIFSLAFSPDDRWLLSGGVELSPRKDFGEATVQIWNTAEKKLHAKIKPHTFPVLSMALTRDGKTLVTCSMDQTVKVWSMPKEYWRKAPK